MNKRHKIILTQVNRFGALRFIQLQKLCGSHAVRSTIYKHLKYLVNDGLATHVFHPGRGILGYGSTTDGLKLALGVEKEIPKSNRDRDLYHTFMCTETFIELFHYAWVHGIATEFELDKNDLDGILFHRVPDGLIFVRQTHGDFDLAVEVEASPKSKDRIREMVLSYREVFESKLQCASVIIVACTKLIYDRYLAEIEKLPKDLQKNFMLFNSPKLVGLKTTVFGERRQRITNRVDFMRTLSTEGPIYIPILSAGCNESASNAP